MTTRQPLSADMHCADPPATYARVQATPSNADPAWLSRAAFPFTSRYVELHGQRLHYIDEGAGPALLFFHGNPTWSFLYRQIIQGLLPHYRCIAVDYPGFGLSRASADYDYTPAAHVHVLQDFVRWLDLSEFRIVGHDWGGPIGFATALVTPARLTGAILFNTFTWPAQGDVHFERFSRFTGGTLGTLLVSRFNLLLKLMMTQAFGRSRIDARARAAYSGPFARPGSRRAMSVFAREILDSRAFLSELEERIATLRALPVLILWPGRDIAFKRRHCERLQRVFPRHETVLLPQAGHYPQEDCPEVIVAAMRDWLRACATAPQALAGSGRHEGR